MSSPIDDFDLDIRLRTEETPGVGRVGVPGTLVQNSACWTNCPASDCRCPD